MTWRAISGIQTLGDGACFECATTEAGFGSCSSHLFLFQLNSTRHQHAGSGSLTVCSYCTGCEALVGGVPLTLPRVPAPRGAQARAVPNAGAGSALLTQRADRSLSFYSLSLTHWRLFCP